MAGIRDRIKIRFLTPLFIVLVILLAASATSIYRMQRNDMQNDIQSRLSGMERLYQTLLLRDTRFLKVAAEFIQEDDDIQQAWAKKDQALLAQLIQPVFSQLRASSPIHQLYFVMTNRVCFYRAHAPEFCGDMVEHYTLEKTIAKGQPVHGLEIDDAGELTLRMVLPWTIQGQLAGYVELGMRTDHLLPSLKSVLESEVYSFLYKTRLTQTAWENPAQTDKLRRAWNHFEHVVLAEQTMSRLPSELVTLMNEPFESRDGMQFRFIAGSRRYRGGSSSIRDVTGRPVGELVLLREVTQEEAHLRNSLIFLSLTNLILILILFTFFYTQIELATFSLQTSHEKLMQDLERCRNTCPNAPQEDDKA